MKKSIFAVVVAVLLFGFSNVDAMSKSELQAKLTQTYVINGVEFKVNESQKAQIERYIATNDISEKDADFIAARAKDAVKVIEAAGVKSLDELDSASKSQLVSLINSVSEKTSVKVSVADNGDVKVYNLDGTLFTTVTKNVVKQTNNNNIIVLSSLVSLLGIAFVAKKFF